MLELLRSLLGQSITITIDQNDSKQIVVTATIGSTTATSQQPPVAEKPATQSKATAKGTKAVVSKAAVTAVVNAPVTTIELITQEAEERCRLDASEEGLRDIIHFLLEEQKKASKAVQEEIAKLLYAYRFNLQKVLNDDPEEPKAITPNPKALATANVVAEEEEVAEVAAAEDDDMPFSVAD